MIAGILTFLRTAPGKVAIGVGMLAIVLFLSYMWGRADCGRKHSRIAAQQAREWAEKVRVSEAAAYDRGLVAARLELENDKTTENIVRDAGMEAGAHDLCLSADIVERLRALQ